LDGPLPKTEAGALPQGGWALLAAITVALGALLLQVHRVAEAKVVGLPVVVDDPAKLDVGERCDGEN